MKIAVVGGDARMLVAARLFGENGFETATAALGEGSAGIKNALCGAAAAVLPLPYEKGGILNSPMSNEAINIDEVFAAAEGGTLFIGGGLSQRGGDFADYAVREDFLLQNAVITAEAAVEIALRETKSTLFGAKILIIGYGRIGTQLTRLLTAFGSSVTVAARRSESRLLAELSGAHSADVADLAKHARAAEIIFNTVPQLMLGEKELKQLKSNALIIDLASGAGGCDKAAAEKLGIRLIHALALPGKHAPEAAGKAVFKAATEILCERGLIK